MSETTIRLEGIGKKYQIGQQREKYQTIRETLSDVIVSPFRRAGKLLRGQASGAADLDETIWALQDISFEVKQGEVIGIIGRNGAGKSTLLKLLSRITEPTRGRIRLRGRVGALLEVGTGFHPELTGRENIYLNGTILGMKRGEIDSKFDEIVAFAGTESFLDTPVKHYSSGMHVRLAFAVAAHLEPAILVIDEVLAVGDAAFQRKCLGKMEDVANTGRTVLFVSHNMAAVSALCTKGFLLSEGRLVYTGGISDVIGEYLKDMNQEVNTSLAQRQNRRGDGKVRFTDVAFVDAQGKRTPGAVSGKPLTILLRYVTADQQEAKDVDMDVAFYGALGQLLFYCKVQLGRGRFEVIPPAGQIACHIPNFPLSPGRYRFKLWCQSSRSTADLIENAGMLQVEAGDFFGTGNLPTKNAEGVVMVPHHWNLVKPDPYACDQ